MGERLRDRDALVFVSKRKIIIGAPIMLMLSQAGCGVEREDEERMQPARCRFAVTGGETGDANVDLL